MRVYNSNNSCHVLQDDSVLFARDELKRLHMIIQTNKYQLVRIQTRITQKYSYFIDLLPDDKGFKHEVSVLNSDIKEVQ